MAFGDFTVTRASTKNILGSAGLYVSVANNVPAFEFNADGSYRGLLVEPGATNILLRSQEFDNASWAKIQTGTGLVPVVTANSAIAPDGTMTADTIVFNRVGNLVGDISQIRQTPTYTNGLIYTSSFYAQASAPSEVGKELAFRSLDGAYAPIITLTSEWVRYTLTGVALADSSFRIESRGTISADVEVSANIWQAQVELGSVATSPIVTTAGTASRVADVVSLTGASSLIGASGTLYAEINWRSRTESAARIIFGLEQTGTTNNIRLSFGGTNQLQLTALAINAGSVVAISSATLGQFPAGITKLALAYDGTGVQMFVNGTAITLGSPTGSYPSVNAVVIGSRAGEQFLNDHISACAVFPTRLSNAQIQSLTTL